MSTIFEMIKRNAVPAAVMRTASKGALPVPAEQMLEILVYLTQNPVFAQDAYAQLMAAGAERVVSTDSILHPSNAISIAGLLAAACAGLFGSAS